MSPKKFPILVQIINYLIFYVILYYFAIPDLWDAFLNLEEFIKELLNLTETLNFGNIIWHTLKWWYIKSLLIAAQIQIDFLNVSCNNNKFTVFLNNTTNVFLQFLITLVDILLWVTYVISIFALIVLFCIVNKIAFNLHHMWN